MRRDELYLRDILEAVRDLADFVAGLSAETLAEARMVRWNVLVHAYFGIRWKRVWQAAVQEAPALGRQVARILEAEFPNHTSENNA